MIIKISIKNNKFTKYTKEYFNTFYNECFSYEMNCFPLCDEWFEIKREVMEILRSDTITKNGMLKFKKYIELSFNYFLNKKLLEDFDYIKNRCKINIIKSFKDRDENKQSCYWFQHSGTVIIQ